ncbi:acyl-CoA amino acid n-acyltransferase 2 [Plakobranchus ocellatus]|uniref:Acyl-CoA amino acid n-acyltransferase 2 n=1 Tax=Plakobranchus ocellatus TaxID=259542 RepID=A0AAV4BLF6_9GAST|nr:acyl-CoA amino acid n-acyltransferase 2 [Plakobranchus ocellatus]
MRISAFYCNTLFHFGKSFNTKFLKRKPRSVCNLHQYAPKIHVTPTHALIDEEVQIVTNGLHPGQKVTLFAHMVEAKRQYGSCGQYIADDKGVVDTSKNDSQGGTFEGVEPMGLFWSMLIRPKTSIRRLSKEDIMVPYDVTIDVLDGFYDFGDKLWSSGEIQCLTTGQLLRSYSKLGIKRIPVEEDGLHGLIFLPPGDGPFPAVIDIFGFTRESNEFRSALLASHGIASFVIRYIGYKDLPRTIEDIDYNYFLKAFDYLASHPKVDKTALGGVSTCVGGAWLFLIASKRPAMKCLVTVNGVLSPYGSRQTVEGEDIVPADYDLNDATFIDGMMAMTSMYFPDFAKLVRPAWRHGAKILMIQGLDDKCGNPNSLRYLRPFIPKEFLNSVTMVGYPGTGHLLEPPHAPHSLSNYNPYFKKHLLWGGDPKLHARAQEDSWPRILSFLHQHLRSG